MISTCDWQLPKGSTIRLCGRPAQLVVDRMHGKPIDLADTPMPLCGVHLADYIAAHGPARVDLA